MIAIEARIYAVLGSSGAGKSAYIKQQLDRVRPRRLIVWDPKSEYHAGAPGGLPFVERADLREIVKRRAEARYAFAYTPGRDGQGRHVLGYTSVTRAAQFDLICNIALASGDLALVVDELHQVTLASWAPEPWQQVTTMGRGERLWVIGASQSPAHIDKDFLGNATLIHSGVLGEPDHARAVARRMREVTERELLHLAPLEWVEYDKKTRQITRGTLSFPNKSRPRRASKHP